MAFTTPEIVGGVMGFTFASDTNPTRTEVENVLIPMAERKINRLNIPSLSGDDKTDLASLWTAHLIAVSKDVDYRNADISISSQRIPTHYSNEFFEIVVEKGGSTGGKSFFKVANLTRR